MTPLHGIYAYPLTKEYYTKLITNTLPFASDQPYINLFSISDKTNNLYNYDNLEYDVSILQKHYENNDFETIKEHAFEDAYKNTDVSKFWNLTRMLAKNPVKWNALLRKLGYTNFYDPGEGIIHTNEPTQFIVLDPRIIIPIETFLNPYSHKYSNKNYIKDENVEKLTEEEINAILKSNNRVNMNNILYKASHKLKPYQIYFIANNIKYLYEHLEKLKFNQYFKQDTQFLQFILYKALKPNKNINKIVEIIKNNDVKDISFEYGIKNKINIYDNGDIHIYKNNKLNNLTGPSIFFGNGSASYFFDDKPLKYTENHSPADDIEWQNFINNEYINNKANDHLYEKIYFADYLNLKNKTGYFRVIYDDGTNIYTRNQQKHNLNGPAVIHPDGSRLYYRNGVYVGSNLSDEEWQKNNL